MDPIISGLGRTRYFFKLNNFPVLPGLALVPPPTNPCSRSSEVLCPLSNPILFPGWTDRLLWLPSWLLWHASEWKALPLCHPGFPGAGAQLKDFSCCLMFPLVIPANDPKDPSCPPGPRSKCSGPGGLWMLQLPSDQAQGLTPLSSLWSSMMSGPLCSLPSLISRDPH